MTKPGNSGSEEPTEAEAPEATPDTHESPTGAAGGPPNSTLPASTDNSGSAEVGAEPEADGNAAGPAPAEGGAGSESAGAADEAGAPASEATEAVPAGAKSAEGKPAEAKAAESKPADSKAAGAKAAARKPAEDKPSAKARRAKAAETEPLMAELEKAPPPPREQTLRAQTKRRFEEPPPRTLRFSLYFFVAAGGIWLLSMVASLIYKQDIINNEIKRNTNPKITPEQISGAVNQILWIVTIAALAFTIFLALFGYKATEGTRRARTLVTIFAVMLVLFHLLLNGTQLGILSAMFALVGLALLWSPSARRYFPPRQVL